MILVILVLWAFFSGQCCYLCSHYFSTPFVAPQLWGLSLEVLRFLELKVNSSASSQLQLVAGGSLCSSHDPCLVSTFQSQITVFSPYPCVSLLFPHCHTICPDPLTRLGYRPRVLIAECPPLVARWPCLLLDACPGCHSPMMQCPAPHCRCPPGLSYSCVSACCLLLGNSCIVFAAHGWSGLPYQAHPAVADWVSFLRQSVFLVAPLHPLYHILIQKTLSFFIVDFTLDCGSLRDTVFSQTDPKLGEEF